MFYRLFAFFGLAWARRWRDQANADQLAEWLEYLTGAKSARLEERDYAWIEKRFPPGLLAEYREKAQRLRNDYTRQALVAAIAELEERLNVPETKSAIPEIPKAPEREPVKPDSDVVDYITGENVY